MSDTQKIGFIIGSLRKGSYNRMVAKALMERATKNFECTIIEIGDLPLYNEDLDTDTPPEAWTKFRKEVKGMDGIVFVTPEYNRGTTAAIKNAIDVSSRPYGKSVWASKPAAVVSASMSAMGGFGANHQLRQSLVFLDMPVMQQPEAYIGKAQDLFDKDGKLTNEDTGKFFDKIMDTYSNWVKKLT